MRFTDFDGIGSVSFWEWDLQQDLLLPSGSLPRLLGYTKGEFPPSPFFLGLAHPEDIGTLRGKVEAFAAGALAELQSQFRLRCGDGSWKWVLLRGELVERDEEERPLRARGLLLHADSNVRLLEGLLYEKDSLKATISAMRDALFATDSSGTVTMMNEAAVELLGVEDSIGPLGASVYEILPLFRRSDESAVSGFVERAVSEGMELEFTHNLLLRLPNRPELEVSMVVSPMHLEEGARTGAVIVVEDVTAKRRHEEELRQVQKLDSLARLARGISRDLNDALAALLGEVSLVKETLDVEPGCLAELTSIETSAEAIRRISRQLNLFGTLESPVVSGSSVEELVRDAVQYALRGSSVSVSYTFESPSWDIAVNREQFGQLLQNIVMNARDAMEESGTIHVGVRNGGPISSLAAPGGHSVAVMIADEGPGIPEEILPHVFDPYFTTKDRGGGLGLTVARSIASSYGGALSVSSEVGFGTTVMVTLPALPGRHSPTTPPLREEDLPRNKRVLILEDDELVLSVMDRMIRLLGSTPTAVVAGEQAVERARGALEEGNPFDLIISDSAIRGNMSGMDALRQIHTFQPDLPTVLTSGGVDFSDRAFDTSRFAILPKPFTLEDLRSLLASIFER